jgi:hypothetical protein
MTDKATRRERKAAYRENPPPAGIYAITNTTRGRRLVGVSTNLPAVANKLAFARSTGLVGALDARLRPDLEDDGFEALTFEVLEELPPVPGQTDAELKADLQVLLGLWQEKLAGTALY